jgi:hypothetical protein
MPKRAMPGKGKERNNGLRSKESSYENSGSGAENKKNRFRSSRMEDEEEDEAEAERRAIE